MPCTDGPQVFSRPGTKRHLKQLRARAVYNAINLSGANAACQRANAALQIAEQAAAQAQANLDAFTFLACAILPAQGYA